MTNEIERAVHDVQNALNLPEGEGEHLATVVANLIGMASDTDAARVAAQDETDQAREELAKERARVEHLMKYITDHNGKPPMFTYVKPTGRRPRRRTALEPMGVLKALAESFRLPDRAEPETMLEATETGSITSLPRLVQEEIFEVDEYVPPVETEAPSPSFDDIMHGYVPVPEPEPVLDLREYENAPQPLTHRTGFIPVVTEVSVEEYTHDKRGFDIDPLPPEVVSPINTETNSISIVVQATVPSPVKAADVAEAQDVAVMQETKPERRRWWQKRDKK